MAPAMATDNPEPAKSSTEPPAEERLESWKEIAAYLKRDIRTLGRWEKNEGLPVHRHMRDKLPTVYAYKSELDAWWANRQPRLEAEEARGKAVAPALPHWLARRWPLVVVATLALVIGGALWFRFTRPTSPPMKLIPFTTFAGNEFSPTFSPDGSQIAFSWDGEKGDNFDIYV